MVGRVLGSLPQQLGDRKYWLPLVEHWYWRWGRLIQAVGCTRWHIVGVEVMFHRVVLNENHWTWHGLAASPSLQIGGRIAANLRWVSVTSKKKYNTHAATQIAKWLWLRGMCSEFLGWMKQWSVPHPAFKHSQRLCNSLIFSSMSLFSAVSFTIFLLPLVLDFLHTVSVSTITCVISKFDYLCLLLCMPSVATSVTAITRVRCVVWCVILHTTLIIWPRFHLLCNHVMYICGKQNWIYVPWQSLSQSWCSPRVPLASEHVW